MSDNPDLSWELEGGLDRQRAMDFVLQFEATLCVYSPSVEQLYSTYNLYFPEEFRRRMVVLPDPNAFHDTFNGITPESVQGTGLCILPGELLGAEGLYLANIDARRRLSRRKLPFTPAMRSIMQRRPEHDPFLPVLVKGDLRDYNNDWPVLHLHRIRPALLTDRSALDRSSLTRAITDKLERLMRSISGHAVAASPG